MIAEAADIIMNARHVTAFTGAGISVESGIPPFRGKDGLWNKFNPVFLDIDYFHRNPLMRHIMLWQRWKRTET